MVSLAYHNGRYLPKTSACVGLEDRGYHYADGVYEIMLLHHGRLIDETAHYTRLQHSLAAIAVEQMPSIAVIRHIVREVIRKNRAVNDAIYIQITRGEAPRNHAFPTPAVQASLSVQLLNMRMPPQKAITQGIKVCSLPDIRWGRRDIKSISLLPNVLAKQEAIEQGAKEAWLIDPQRHVITEGSSSNSYIITQSGSIKTHPLGPEILGGITRQALLTLAKTLGIFVDETPYSLDEALAAKEAFNSSSTMGIMPVTHINKQAIGDGTAGPLTLQLYAAYQDYLSRA